MKQGKTVIFCLVCIGVLTGCIRFKPIRQAESQPEEEESVESVLRDDSIMAQSNHFKFKGVPIDGTLNKFIERLERNQFKLEESDGGEATLSGDFADFKNCLVHVATLDRKDLVYKISVAFPVQEQWRFLHNDYVHLKELLMEKYGKPASCTERFQDSWGLAPQDDDERMHYVQFDKCKYESRFITSNGEISLWIHHTEAYSCFVMLTYTDRENSRSVKEHALNDL